MNAATVEVELPIKHSWHKRITSLQNVPPIFKMVWEAGPGIVASSLLFRLMAGLVPIAVLGITRRIIDAIYLVSSHQKPLIHGFWFLVALEFILAGLGVVLARMIDFCDTVFKERYTAYVNTKIMRHAATLDLTSYEDPDFYDKLERARGQRADRLGMIQEWGQLIQQFITPQTPSAEMRLTLPYVDVC